MSDHQTLSDLVSEDVPDGVRQICEQLEAHGWYPRKRWAATGVVYYRDGERSRQLIVDVRYEPNEHKLAFWTQHTGIELQPTK